MTADNDYTRANRDLTTGHPLLQERLPRLEARLLHDYGWFIQRIEIYRSDLRQRWLYGANRTVGELAEKGISAHFARPHEKRVTNAWSCHLSAHGWSEKGIPMAAAADIAPVGPDGKPFTADDPWIEFVAVLAAIGPEYGLVHFHAPGKQVTDMPHVELWPEWSNQDHRLILDRVS